MARATPAPFRRARSSGGGGRGGTALGRFPAGVDMGGQAAGSEDTDELDDSLPDVIRTAQGPMDPWSARFNPRDSPTYARDWYREQLERGAPERPPVGKLRTALGIAASMFGPTSGGIASKLLYGDFPRKMTEYRGGLEQLRAAAGEERSDEEAKLNRQLKEEQIGLARKQRETQEQEEIRKQRKDIQDRMGAPLPPPVNIDLPPQQIPGMTMNLPPVPSGQAPPPGVTDPITGKVLPSLPTTGSPPQATLPPTSIPSMDVEPPKIPPRFSVESAGTERYMVPPPDVALKQKADISAEAKMIELDADAIEQAKDKGLLPAASPDGKYRVPASVYSTILRVQKPAGLKGNLGELADAQRLLTDPKATTEEKKAARLFIQNYQAGVAARVANIPPTLPAGGAPVVPGQLNPSVLDGQPSGIQATVKQLAEYKIPLPSGFALKSPYWQAILALTAQYDPSFDATQYNVRMGVRKSFTSGKDSQTVNSINTLVGHLQSLNKSAEALKNAPVQLWNSILNFGLTATGDPRVTNFNTDATAVESELAAIFKATGATDQEIKAWRNNVNASQSPAQLRGVISEAVRLMGSRLDALTNKYETGLGKPKDFTILSKRSRQILQQLGIDPSNLEAAVTPGSTGKATKRYNTQTGKIEDIP